MGTVIYRDGESGRSIALELKKRGIRVRDILPGIYNLQEYLPILSYFGPDAKILEIFLLQNSFVK